MDRAGWTSDRGIQVMMDGRGESWRGRGLGVGAWLGTCSRLLEWGVGGLEENEGSVEARVSGVLFTRVSKSCVSGKMLMRGG